MNIMDTMKMLNMGAITNATQLGEVHKQMEKEKAKTERLNNQAFLQTEELQKQTSILDAAKQLTLQNAEYTKQIAEYTQRNEEASKRYFWAAFIVSIIALVVAIIK